MVGRNKRTSLGQIRSGARDINSKREEANNIFENRIREQLIKARFIVLEKELKVRERNEEHEYDVIGVSEEKLKVLIVEAKYRDFSPSSISGKTLVMQEFLYQDRLLDWAFDAQSKLDFFQKFGERFQRELSLEKVANHYDMSVWIVTKHRPQISKFRDVNILDFFEFCLRVIEIGTSFYENA